MEFQKKRKGKEKADLISAHEAGARAGETPALQGLFFVRGCGGFGGLEAAAPGLSFLPRPASPRPAIRANLRPRMPRALPWP